MCSFDSTLAPHSASHAAGADHRGRLERAVRNCQTFKTNEIVLHPWIFWISVLECIPAMASVEFSLQLLQSI